MHIFGHDLGLGRYHCLLPFTRAQHWSFSRRFKIPWGYFGLLFMLNFLSFPQVYCNITMSEGEGRERKWELGYPPFETPFCLLACFFTLHVPPHICVLSYSWFICRLPLLARREKVDWEDARFVSSLPSLYPYILFVLRGEQPACTR
jgi:hypothetical protein